MASSSAMTTRVGTVGSFLGYERVSAISRSSSSSCVCSSRLIWSMTSARCRCMASAWRWASWCSRSASGVSDTSERRRASSAASARWAELLVGHRELLAELLEARADLGEAAFDERPGHRRSVRPAAPRPGSATMLRCLRPAAVRSRGSCSWAPQPSAGARAGLTRTARAARRRGSPSIRPTSCTCSTTTKASTTCPIPPPPAPTSRVRPWPASSRSRCPGRCRSGSSSAATC